MKRFFSFCQWCGGKRHSDNGCLGTKRIFKVSKSSAFQALAAFHLTKLCWAKKRNQYDLHTLAQKCDYVSNSPLCCTNNVETRAVAKNRLWSKIAFSGFCLRLAGILNSAVAWLCFWRRAVETQPALLWQNVTEKPAVAFKHCWWQQQVTQPVYLVYFLILWGKLLFWITFCCLK